MCFRSEATEDERRRKKKVGKAVSGKINIFIQYGNNSVSDVTEAPRFAFFSRRWNFHAIIKASEGFVKFCGISSALRTVFVVASGA